MSNNTRTIFVCLGTGCVASYSPKIRDAFAEQVKAAGLESQVEVKFSGCHGFCEQGPLVAIEPEGVLYTHVKPEDVPEIVSEHLGKGNYIERLFYVEPMSKKPIPCYKDIPFYGKQTRIILRNCGHIDPENIDDYIAVGGYQALKKVLSQMTPQQVLDEIKRSGLKGRGGAGFSTGQKWEFCRNAQGSPKYIVCNADEGDPGAFMNRSLLEADPHSVLEGMVIGAYAIGADEAYIYIRAEYPLAVKRLRIAIRQMEERGFVGKNILGSNFSFIFHIKEGAGAFVCGEETALIASVEGKRGAPRPRPPFPAIYGLWGRPTNINNVETWANVPLIIKHGVEWYTKFGSATSKGTKTFSLVGKIKNTGLVEVPMGIKLREIIYDIGGGIIGDKQFKAVQTGGPSGGCLPASLLDSPVDYESLAAAGSIMGSGGMIVLDENTCMVDLARYFLDFTQKESCGKCVMCREGTMQMLEILKDITEGKGKAEDIDLLLELAETVKAGSLCALGGTAPNPILTTLRYFRPEFEAHIKEKRCPALVCQKLVSYYVLPDKCQGCQICLRSCPVNAIAGGKRMVHIVDQEKCIKCGTCYEVCPARFSAVAKVSGQKLEVPKEPVPVASGK